VPKARLVALKDRLAEVAHRDSDGHLLGGVILRVLEDELEHGRDDERWTLAASDFEEAVGMLRSVFERLALL
jgi:hypothetical protein